MPCDRVAEDGQDTRSWVVGAQQERHRPGLTPKPAPEKPAQYGENVRRSDNPVDGLVLQEQAERDHQAHAEMNDRSDAPNVARVAGRPDHAPRHVREYTEHEESDNPALIKALTDPAPENALGEE
eukprot:CAMPEP_0202058446 /NCGR_PEP_ID=MMETSP0963-20130614/31939_1 /ASSEMBLY_ACC=CAM_ASM_000494 /TAXON_ID=4773 /ORGANISM="Schizochytrium aggregatum, Strain ATCC28209" /LENGTH=124 /DNA_ID=CAMNT_0048624405 /DNA_START=73 /DNA_END=447 /DNA_ORIENTATION=+